MSIFFKYIFMICIYVFIEVQLSLIPMPLIQSWKKFRGRRQRALLQRPCWVSRQDQTWKVQKSKDELIC